MYVLMYVCMCISHQTLLSLPGNSFTELLDLMPFAHETDLVEIEIIKNNNKFVRHSTVSPPIKFTAFMRETTV